MQLCYQRNCVIHIPWQWNEIMFRAKPRSSEDLIFCPNNTLHENVNFYLLLQDIMRTTVYFYVRSTSWHLKSTVVFQWYRGTNSLKLTLFEVIFSMRFAQMIRKFCIYLLLSYLDYSFTDFVMTMNAPSYSQWSHNTKAVVYSTPSLNIIPCDFVLYTTVLFLWQKLTQYTS